MPLLSINTIKTIITRGIGEARGKKPFKYEGGIKYPGFYYYPKTPDFKDPPYEPSKLLMLQRIKTQKGLPYWEKKILKRFGLHEKTSDVSVVKNIPENSAYLWRIKHLIRIKPITFPNGFPQSTKGTYLKENGELTVQKHVHMEEGIKAWDDYMNDPKRMDADTLRRQSRQKWLDGW